MNNAHSRSLRIGSTMALMSALLLPGCAGSGHVVPPAPLANGSSASSSSAKSTASFRITVPKATAPSSQSRSVKYVSPATTQMTIDVQQNGASIGGQFPETVALTPTSTGCSSTLAGTQCQLGFSVAPGSYTIFLTANDAGGTALSAVSGMAFTVVAGQANQIAISLGGIPTSVAVVPGASTALSGSATSGYSLSRCTSTAQNVNVLGVDADANYILGAGAPTASLTSGGLTIPAASSTAPNAFAVSLASAPASAGSTTLVAGVSYNTGSGVQNVSATIPFAITPDICGQVTTLATGPNPLYGMAFDASGNLIIAGGNYVDELPPGGSISHLAGSGVQGHADESTATPTTATFNNTRGIAVDRSNNIFVTDTFNNTIRRIDTSGNVTTFAGTAGSSGSHDAQGTSATFNDPWGIVADTVGNLYVTDASSNKIRKIDTSGNVTTIAGSGAASSSDGSGLSASFNFPTGITIDPLGNLFVVDGGDGNVRKIDTSGNVTTIAAAVSGDALSIAIDPNGTLYVTLTQGPNFNPGIIKVSQAGAFSDIAGGPNSCQSGCNIHDGFGFAASFAAPAGLLVGPGFKLYVADQSQGSIRIVQ